jgi:hypothetical protein
VRGKDSGLRVLWAGGDDNKRDLGCTLVHPPRRMVQRTPMHRYYGNFGRITAPTASKGTTFTPHHSKIRICRWYVIPRSHDSPNIHSKLRNDRSQRRNTPQRTHPRTPTPTPGQMITHPRTSTQRHRTVKDEYTTASREYVAIRSIWGQKLGRDTSE